VALTAFVNRIEEKIKKCQKCQNPCNGGLNPKESNAITAKDLAKYEKSGMVGRL
jgi:ribosomal protein L37AE/L43A